MSDSVENRHPDYLDRIEEWRMLRDCARGPKAVKERGVDYLPMPSGFAAQPDLGVSMYDAYKMRSQFPDILNPTLMGMVGLIHSKEPKIEMPKAMEKIWESSTKDRLSLEALYRRITSEVFLMGRYMILPDASPNGSDVPWLAGYTAESLINWSEDRDFFVLDESGLVRNGFNWDHQNRWRVLELVNGVYVQRIIRETDDQGTVVVPTASGGRQLPEIPAVIIGPTDLAVEPAEPPLIGVARAALAIYRLDADYRHQLFNTGQETFVIEGGPSKEEMPQFVGSGVILGLPKESKAHYVGISGKGIEAHERAIANERQNAVNAGARMLDNEIVDRESGKAKKIRYAFQKANLSSISISCAAGLEQALRHVAIFMGEDPEKVIVKPNLEFFDTEMPAQDVVNLVDAWQKGAFSYDTLYENLQRGKVASPERDAQTEKSIVEEEQKKREEAALRAAASSSVTNSGNGPGRMPPKAVQ